MVFILKFIIFLIASALGIYFIANQEKMVRLVGKNEYAEKVTRAGSYLMWVLIGAIIIFLGFMTLIGTLDWLYGW